MIAKLCIGCFVRLKARSFGKLTGVFADRCILDMVQIMELGIHDGDHNIFIIDQLD